MLTFQAAFSGMILTAMVTLVCSFQDDADWHQETMAWRAAREQKLKAPDGWLSVSGLFYLKTGDQTFGSAADCQIHLTSASLPNIAGTLTVTERSISFRAADGVSLRLNDRNVNTGFLRIDPVLPEADSPDRLTIGTTSLQLIRRSGRLAIRSRDSANPLIAAFPGERWYPPDRKYRVVGTFTPYTEPKTLMIQNIQGESHEETLGGFAEFRIGDQDFRLEAIADSPETLFFIFKDHTSGQETYGAGRFLTVPRPVGSTIVLDFNRAYNPPCAFNPFTLCPVPPAENHLAIAITAGALKPLKP
ncbi:MAG: hypothetical protein RLZZ232_3471 [Planctomycetota bacterium]